MCVFGEESHLAFRIATIRTVRVSLHQLPNGETVGRFAGGEREVLSHRWPQMGRWLVFLFVEPRLIGNLDVVSVRVADICREVVGTPFGPKARFLDCSSSRVYRRLVAGRDRG